ncbi:putative MFS family arabinose efflux permease [Erwinia toletana]|uniref:MFS family arabinose efflux permease n=1 Tax=Winslowiella toletana TaxID=92490 RepID=A0ABS4PEH7_9GAMM|nr:MFS transporter [Winslowiella toletana]MBP2171034.1 putative MFS family arabinose efflux permease [Winslowiella toletana]
MNNANHLRTTSSAQQQPAWGAVFSMALGVFGLVTAEFLPASLLTPMAASLEASEALTGQAVTITAVVALITSFVSASATRKMDRRWVLLAFSVMLIVSNLLVAFAPQLSFVFAGRVLLGVAIGGFWTLSAATAMRLVPAALIPRALSIIFSGVSVATIAAAPLGSYFGDLIGWRNVFIAAAAIGALALVWQIASLPKMPPAAAGHTSNFLTVLKRPGIQMAMFAVILVFSGHFAFFTYLRPFLENVTGVGVNGLSAILLGFGVANFAGTLLAGLLLERNLNLTLMMTPLVMGIMGVALVLLGFAPMIDALLIALWGMAFGAVPVGWSTWLTRTMPDDAESGGGLMVAAVQLAIAVGAAAGGAIFNLGGARGVFIGSALALLIATVTIYIALRPKPAMA